MNILLIFFAIPVAVIIMSIILEKYMRCPLAVSGLFFSIFLIIAFLLGAFPEYFVMTFVYTIISFVVSYIYERVTLSSVNENNYSCRCRRCG